MNMRMMYYSVSGTGILGKNPSAPISSRTEDHPITSSDALPLSYRRLGQTSCILLRLECHVWHMRNGINVIEHFKPGSSCSNSG